jgi:hypothetical protein
VTVKSDVGLCFVCILQSYCYYYSIQGAESEDAIYEQSCLDGAIQARRWTSRTVKVTGHVNGHSAQSRVQHSLEHLDREWITLLQRPLYYLILVKSRERLQGWDYLVSSHPPQARTAELFGRLTGPTVRARLIWLLDDLFRANLPELPIIQVRNTTCLARLPKQM